MAHEINLVPEIKNEMIKALKLRNLIFFICIVVAASAIGVIIIFGSIVGGQSIALNSKANTLTLMSKTINGYEDLDDFLTIQDQVGSLSKISNNKMLVSRVFNFVTILAPTNGDTIEISEMSLNLASSSLVLEAQADAVTAPYIDYNVLDAFKKSMKYLTYDYGMYVDRDGNEIPSYCIVDSNNSGTFFMQNKDLYAFWLIDVVGCAPEGEDYYISDYEDYMGQRVVRIWRSPQFDNWYNNGYMELDGSISGVEHFESSCKGYHGEEDEFGSVTWKPNDSTCNLVPDGESGIRITDSSNGRDSSGDLVLRFTATILFEDDAFKFSNPNMIFFGPDGKYTVTDSYLQLQKMFGERAADCLKGDTSCLSASTGGY